MYQESDYTKMHNSEPEN